MRGLTGRMRDAFSSKRKYFHPFPGKLIPARKYFDCFLSQWNIFIREVSYNERFFVNNFLICFFISCQTARPESHVEPGWRWWSWRTLIWYFLQNFYPPGLHNVRTLHWKVFFLLISEGRSLNVFYCAVKPCQNFLPLLHQSSFCKSSWFYKWNFKEFYSDNFIINKFATFVVNVEFVECVPSKYFVFLLYHANVLTLKLHI